MIYFFIVVMLLGTMVVLGASRITTVIGCAMLIAGFKLLIWVDHWAQQRKSPSSAAPTETYQAVNICVSLLIGLPPIFLLPDAHPFAYVGFQILGMAIGTIVAQRLSTTADGGHPTFCPNCEPPSAARQEPSQPIIKQPDVLAS
jgi:hypothetical protein